MKASEESQNISRKKLYKMRRDKIQTQIEAAVRLLGENVEPLEVADSFIHQSFQIMKEGVSQRNPALSEGEINQKVRRMLSMSDKLKESRKRRETHG
jgi:hypothetical protein